MFTMKMRHFSRREFLPLKFWTLQEEELKAVIFNGLLPLAFRLSDQSTQLEYRRPSATFIHCLKGFKLQIWDRLISVYCTRIWFVHYQFSWKGLWWGSRVEQGMPALPQLLQLAWTLEKGKLVAFANTAENGHLGKKEWSNNWEQDGNEKALYRV